MTIYTDRDGWFSPPGDGAIPLSPVPGTCPTCGGGGRLIRIEQRSDGRARVAFEACGHPWVNERPLRLVRPPE